MPAREPGGRRSWARITALAIGSLLLLAAVAVGSVLIWGKSAAKTVNAQCQAKLEAIRKAGEPASGAELNVWYEQPPAGENAADFFLAGFELVQISAQDANSADLPLIGKGKLPPPGQPLPAAAKKAIGDFLARNRPALEKFEQGARCAKSRYPLDFREGPSMKLKHVSQVKQAAQMAQLSAVYQADQKDAEGACQAVRLGLALARSLEAEPIMISQLVRASGLGFAQYAAECVVNRLALSPAQLADLQRAFALAEDTNGTTCALLGERAMSLDKLQLPPEQLAQGLGDMDPKIRAYLETMRRTGNRDLNFALDFWKYQVDVSRKLLAQRQQATAECERMLKEAKEQKLILASSLLPNFGPELQHGIRGLDSVRVAQAAVAVERFRAANGGRLPAVLGDLCSSYLAAVPIDPHDEQPLRYATRGQGYVVYSVGRDGKDDGGVEGKDVVFAVAK
jgi:hypothetical protein